MKRKSLLTIALIAVLALMLAGCGKSVLTGEMDPEGRSFVITAENAGEGDFFSSGTLIAEEGDTLIVDGQLEAGEINIVLSGGIETEDIDADAEELLDADAEPVLDLDVAVGEGFEATLPAGSYYVTVTVLEKATGTITLTLDSEATGLANPWTDVATADEAAAGAGLDGFDLPEGSEISLGAVTPAGFRWMDCIAEADIEFPAVQMTIRKGLVSEFPDGDVSGDYNVYANEWTQNIKGLEVTCYGNREGDASKTIWTSGDYAYSITVLGLGGDTDYGLSADDLNSLINGIQ